MRNAPQENAQAERIEAPQAAAVRNVETIPSMTCVNAMREERPKRSIPVEEP